MNGWMDLGINFPKRIEELCSNKYKKFMKEDEHMGELKCSLLLKCSCQPKLSEAALSKLQQNFLAEVKEIKVPNL